MNTSSGAGVIGMKGSRVRCVKTRPSNEKSPAEGKGTFHGAVAMMTCGAESEEDQPVVDLK